MSEFDSLKEKYQIILVDINESTGEVTYTPMTKMQYYKHKLKNTFKNIFKKN